MWSQPEVCFHSGPAVDLIGNPIVLPSRSPKDSDRIIDFFLHGQKQRTRLRWALILSTNEEFVGTIGFNALGECAEIAYHLRPDYWGRGLMAEAATKALQWVQEEGGAMGVEAFIEPGNIPSVRIASRLGLSPTGEHVDGADRYYRALR